MTIKAAAGAYRALAFAGAYGHVAVDDMAVGAFSTKLIEYHVTHLLVLAQLVIPAFALLVRLRSP